MSTHDVSYLCPYCGKTFTITITDSINASDEDERDRAVSGDVFRHSCPHCKKDFMIQNDLVYSDPNHKFVLWVSEKEPGEELKQFAVPLVKAGYTLRRCPTIQEFVDKVQILEDGVSDIMAELAKYDSFIEFVDNKKGNPEDITAVEYQRTENGIMKINVRTDDKGMAFIIPVAMLEEEMNQNPEEYKVEDEQFPVVNSEWLLSLYQKPDGVA